MLSNEAPVYNYGVWTVTFHKGEKINTEGMSLYVWDLDMCCVDNLRNVLHANNLRNVLTHNDPCQGIRADSSNYIYPISVYFVCVFTFSTISKSFLRSLSGPFVTLYFLLTS